MENGVEIDLVIPGLIHDTKGRKAASYGIITGHASIFTTGSDLLNFLKSFLDNTLLTEETIKLMLSHKDKNKENLEILKKVVSEKEVNEMYEEAKKRNPELRIMRTYNFMGTRYRNNIQELNDVPAICSENTIAFSGFTGPSFLIDFNAHIIIVVMCNVMHRTK